MKEIIQSTYFNASLLAGIVFLTMGFFIRRFPPKSKNTWYGYRSTLSTKNTAMWYAANNHAAYISRRLGTLLIIFGIGCAIFFTRQTEVFFYCTITPVIMSVLYMAGYTEWRLSQEFDEEGNRMEE
ncbi:SdpI family protein [Chitinophaga pendula]|uniref:SdpI family protein n=1 Tax=Chitinophaga TaxID=79328 RepID=UPI000BAF6894|nr:MULTISPECIES: SdpI family protein [Chitinophaga]ASZ11593.1 hypothetical protein CK934_11800 [Chitinophaga sp. MD30]UCJ05397.1 SdpI family protein [Chitinophaga pendula]